MMVLAFRKREYIFLNTIIKCPIMVHMYTYSANKLNLNCYIRIWIRGKITEDRDWVTFEIFYKNLLG